MRLCGCGRADRSGKKLILEGDGEANYAYYALHKFHWRPAEFMALDPYERAFVIAAIDIRLERERRDAEGLKRKARR